MTTTARCRLIRIVAALRRLRRLLRRAPVLSREQKARIWYKVETDCGHAQIYKTVRIQWYWVSGNWQKGERDER